MAKTRIFPSSIINQSSENFIYEFSPIGNAIYIIVICSVLAAIIALFWIKVDISVKAVAQIKPFGDRTIITSPADGYIDFIHLQENLAIAKGDTLFMIHSQVITSQLPALNNRKVELQEFISDLNSLLHSNVWEQLKLQSSNYISKRSYFISQLKQITANKEFLEKNYQRNLSLFNEKIIAPADFEKIKSEYDKSISDITIYIDNNMAQWENDKTIFQKEIRDIDTQISQINIQSDETIICSPVDGTIQKIAAIADNAYIHSSQQILEISPKGNLMAECAVSPRDIGLLRIGQNVRIQIDAFNYNDWGIITGKITEIFDDIVIPNNNSSTAYFKVYCSLDSTKLTLKNGYSCELKKGMTAYTQFIVTQRTLAQLLYDKVDNWLNPNIKQI